jgi:flagellar FliJ protein
MSASPSLDLVIRVATDCRNVAARALAGSRNQANEAQRKLEMLARYRDDYVGRLNGGPEGGNTDPVRMANTRAFIHKLEQAIVQQQGEVDTRESVAEGCFHKMTAKGKHLRSLETLRDRRDHEAARVASRQEQKRTDEFGARAARLGGAALNLRAS